MWNDFQYENWYDRGQAVKSEDKETMLSEYERLKLEAGVDL
jgi:hypothetical protein